MRESGSDKTHSQESKSEKNCQAPVQGITFLALVSIILVVFILIFYRNDEVPSGFYIDEAAGVLHAICIAESGVDAWDFKSYPLFFTADTSGIHSPIFVYLNAVWGSVFGFSVGSLRSLAGIVTIFTIFGTAKLLSILIGKDAFWISLLIAATSPWGFHFSRIAWDDYLLQDQIKNAKSFDGKMILKKIISGINENPILFSNKKLFYKKLNFTNVYYISIVNQ